MEKKYIILLVITMLLIIGAIIYAVTVSSNEAAQSVWFPRPRTDSTRCPPCKEPTPCPKCQEPVPCPPCPPCEVGETKFVRRYDANNTWNPDMLYLQGDEVIVDGKVYKARLSVGDFFPKEIIEQDFVAQGDGRYISKKPRERADFNHIIGRVFDSVDKYRPITKWDPTVSYNKGDLVSTKEGMAFECLKGCPSSSVPPSRSNEPGTVRIWREVR